MAERVTIHQNKDFATGFWAADPHNPESEELNPVDHLNELTPYGMMLAGLAGCTAILLNSYARNHQINLEEVEIRLDYDRDFDQDCQDCTPEQAFTERIHEELVFQGDLSEDDRKRLFQISRHCPIHKILEDGIKIESELVK